VKTGRPAKRERTPFGQRLHTLESRQASLNNSSPIDSDLPNEPMRTGKRHPVALHPDQLLGLAEVLNVSVEDLVGSNGTKKRGIGPTGKMKQLSKPPLNSRAASNRRLLLSWKLLSTNTHGERT
jgi:hypothetical protein